jgi:UDP-glucose 4-epimerase
MSVVLVTGASGFVGNALCNYLKISGYQVRMAFRGDSTGNPEGIVVGDINSQTEWSIALDDCDYVVHLAARVHIMSDRVENPAALYLETNTEGTRNLALQASASGVKRLVFLSSIKVNGEHTLGKPFSAEDVPSPQDDYALSKCQAEHALIDICTHTKMEYVIIRPPLIYGLGVKANFLSLLKLVHSHIPLPLASLENKRSLLALDNLVDFIGMVLVNDKAANEVFLISDGVDVSTPQLITKIANAFHQSPRLFSFPGPILKGLATIAGKQAAFERLQSSLQLDISKAVKQLGWQPSISQDDAIQNTADWFIREVVH